MQLGANGIENPKATRWWDEAGAEVSPPTAPFPEKNEIILRKLMFEVLWLMVMNLFGFYVTDNDLERPNTVDYERLQYITWPFIT